MKSLISLIFLLGIFTYTWAAGGEYFRVNNVANNDTLNVREKPSAKAKKVGELMPYDTGILIRQCKQVKQSNWCKIDLLEDTIFYEREIFNGGWVNKYYLEKAKNNITLNSASYYKVTNTAANDVLMVREHPFIQSNDVAELKPDAKCHLVVRCQKIKKNNWCYIVHNTYSIGTTMHNKKIHIPVLGWVNGKYLEKDSSPACMTMDNPFFDLSFSGES